MAQYENLEGWEKLSLGMQLDKWAIRYGNRIAVTDSEEEITYSELNQKAIGTGQYFMEKGIQKGDKVLVQLPNRISFVVVLFALAKIGAVPIMMLPAHRETELEGIIALAKPSAYIVAERYLGFYYVEMAMAMQKKFPCIQNVFVDGTQRGAWYEAETERQGVFPEVDSYSTAVLLLSGGTTGVPKLIPRTHTDYMYNARMSAKRCQLDESSVYLAALPVAHNFPLCCPGLLGTFDIGGKVVLAPTTSPDDILTAITEEKVTITALVPAMVTVCMEMLEYDEDYDISSLKILQVGGAMLEDSLADKIIEEWPCTLMQVFGTAEGLLSFTSPDDDVTVIARCQGTPVSPADEVKIVDENDEEVPTGVFGELLSRGPYTIDGYYMAEETNRTSFTEDGFYRTGDKAMWTGKGHLRMGGRIKEQINRAGEKIMPAEIEAYLCKHSDIIGHCIGGLIAIETAKELLKQGTEVDLVTMISTNIYDGDDKKREENFQILQSNLILEKVFGRLIGADVRKSGFTITDTKLMEAIRVICQKGKFVEEKLVELTGEYQEVANMCQKLLESSHQERLRSLFSAREGKVRHAENKEDREVLFEIFKHNLLAALYYEVTDYCGNIKLLRCCNQTENFFINMIDGFSEDDMVWRKSKVKDIVTGEVQGDHISCMEFPYIKENINLIIEGI